MLECNCASSLPFNGLHGLACYTSWTQHKVDTMRLDRHFLFECQNEDLVALRTKLQLHKRFEMLTDGVVVASGVARDSLVRRQ